VIELTTTVLGGKTTFATTTTISSTTTTTTHLPPRDREGLSTTRYRQSPLIHTRERGEVDMALYTRRREERAGRRREVEGDDHNSCLYYY